MMNTLVGLPKILLIFSEVKLVLLEARIDYGRDLRNYLLSNVYHPLHEGLRFHCRNQNFNQKEQGVYNFTANIFQNSKIA